MSKMKESREARQTDASLTKSIGNSPKHAAANSQAKSMDNDFEETFQNFKKIYYDELNLYKRSIKRMSEKSQEMEISLLEYKAALDKSQETIIGKDSEIKKHIADKNIMREEENKLLQQYHNLQKVYVENEVKYAKKFEQVFKEHERNEMQIINERENYIKTVKELTEKLDDVMQKLEAEKQEVSNLKKQLQMASENNEKQIKQLQTTFDEQKLRYEAESRLEIEQIMNKYALEKENVEFSKMNTINLQSEEIEKLREQLKKNQELNNDLENENKRLVAEQNYRISTIERVFSKPLNSIIPNRSSANEDISIIANPQTMRNLADGNTSISSAKNTSLNDSSTKPRGHQRKHQKIQEEPCMNKNQQKNTSNISFSSSKPRAAKRKTNYAMYKDFTSSEEDLRNTQLPINEIKIPRLDPLPSSINSLMRFQTVINANGKDSVVLETSESDPFERLKSL